MSVSEKIDAKQVKELREKSGAPMGDCLKALQEAKGNIEEAFVVLRKRGMASAQKKASRSTNDGSVYPYIHAGGKLGVLVAIETTGDAHAANAFARRVAMHVAATSPMALTTEELDPAAIEREKAIFSDQARQSGKPEAIIEKMVEGRLRKFYEEVVLLKQAFVLNPDITVEKALKDAEKDIGAPAKITAYLRFALGEGIEKEETDFAAEVAAAVKK